MNAKKEKQMRRLFREICKRNNVEPSEAFWKVYRRNLKNVGMWEQFKRNSESVVL